MLQPRNTSPVTVVRPLARGTIVAALGTARGAGAPQTPDNPARRGAAANEPERLSEAKDAGT